MASYYLPPPSPFSGRPPTSLMERMNLYTPDVYAPPTTSSLQPYPQAPELPLPVQKTFKTFLQWKADAQAMTADYQRNGFPSPVAWVFLLSLLPPTILTCHVGICRGSCHPSKCHSWGCRPQGAVEYCPSILRGHILSFPALGTT